MIPHGIRHGQLSTTAALVSVIAVLVLTNLANNRWARSWILLTAVVVSAVLIAIMFWAGGSWVDLGLSRDSLGSGLRWALCLIGIVAAGYLLGAVLPFTRGLFEDQRTSGLTGPEVLRKVLITVPIGTVLLEEIAFRGALYGLVMRARGMLTATLFSSALFGLWHILPSLHLNEDKPTLGSLFGHSVVGAVLVDIGAVLFTAAAGCLLCWLRHRSGSLLAPMALHWATNALGYVFGFLLR